MKIYGFNSYGGPEVEEFLDVPEPVLRPGTVLIETVAVGVNPADIKVRSGARQAGFPVEFPMAMGREAAGIVVDSWRSPKSEEFAAARVRPGQPIPPAFPVGATVFGSCAEGVGALGERTLLEESSVAGAVSGLSLERAACIPVAVGTAFDAVSELDIGHGENVVVLGAGGGVGIHAAQFAAMAGACVFGVASEEKKDFVELRGVRHVPSGPGLAERVSEAVRNVSGPSRVDALIDCVGGDALRELAALVDRSAGGNGRSRRIRSLADKETVAEVGGSGVRRRRTSEVFGDIAERARRRDFEISLSDVIPFGNAHDAMRVVEGGHARGKIVVTFPKGETPYLAEGSDVE